MDSIKMLVTANKHLLLPLLPVVLAVYLALRYNRLRHIPGPPLAAIADVGLQNRLWSGESFPDMISGLHRQYSPVVRGVPERHTYHTETSVCGSCTQGSILPRMLT